MPRKRRNVTMKDVERWEVGWQSSFDKGDYIPWHRVADVPSHGRSRECRSITCNREHHLLSDLEYKYCLYLDFNQNTTNIYEQFPLFPLSETLYIAKKFVTASSVAF